MLDKRKLVLDTFCEVYDLLKPWADAEFWNFASHEIIPGAIYLVGRQQVIENLSRIKELVDNNICQIILSNPAEGSDTQRRHCIGWGIDHYIKDRRMLMISGGDIETPWANLQYDAFLPKILDYQENLDAIALSDEIFTKQHKPYKFLFLNGRFRLHRKYLLEKLNLTHALWTNLDLGNGEIKYLPQEYEFNFYQSNIGIQSNERFVKHQLFNNTWGEIYLSPKPYIDTYFSLVSETVFDYPYSFRTEKIWKPIAIGHPFIVAANAGYYRDLHNLGFKTFGHVIDESFDLIDDNQQRIDRIIDIVNDICSGDLKSFLYECRAVCKYNQQHLVEMQMKVRQEFPDRFFQFLNDNN